MAKAKKESVQDKEVEKIFTGQILFTYPEMEFILQSLATVKINIVHGDQLIARNKVFKALQVKFDEFNSIRMDMLQKYASKDEKGEMKLAEDKRSYEIKPDNKVKFDEEFKILLDKGFEVDILPSIKKDFKLIPEIIKKTNRDLNYTETEIYLSICEKITKL